MRKLIALILIIFLLPISLAQEEYADKIFIESDDVIVEDSKVSFWKSLFASPEQSVLESQVTGDKTITATNRVTADLIYQSKKYDALAYRIYIYFYDTNLKKHTSGVHTQIFDRPLPKGELRNFKFTSAPVGNILTAENANHYIGVVGILKLKVEKSALTAEDLLKAEGCSGTTCWIYERYNSIGQIGTNAFNPAFFYSVPSTISCPKTGYIDQPYCDGNIVRQNYVEQDCSITKKMVKSCGLNKCSKGACIKTACQMTGEVISQACISSQFQRKTYDANCQIITQTIGICDEPEPTETNPIPTDLEIPTEEFPCVPVTESCAGGETITLFSCPGLVPTPESCPLIIGPISPQPTLPVMPPPPNKFFQTIQENFPISILIVILAFVALILVVRRYQR